MRVQTGICTKADEFPMKLEWLCHFLGPLFEAFGEPGSELPKISLPRTPVDNEGVGSLIQNTMTSEAWFRAELPVYGVERLELARA